MAVINQHEFQHFSENCINFTMNLHLWELGSRNKKSEVTAWHEASESGALSPCGQRFILVDCLRSAQPAAMLNVSALDRSPWQVMQFTVAANEVFLLEGRTPESCAYFDLGDLPLLLKMPREEQWEEFALPVWQPPCSRSWGQALFSKSTLPTGNSTRRQ